MRIVLFVVVAGGVAAGAWVAVPTGTTAAKQRPPEPEPIERVVEHSVRRVSTSPQRTVEVVSGRSILRRTGRSHRVVSARFVPDGPPEPAGGVALTFDDGPSEYTGRFLALLEHFRVPATFFVVGTQVEQFSELVRLEFDAGMAVGNHSWSHPWRTPFAALPRGQILEEVVRGDQALHRLGIDSVLFRPPGGTVSSFVLRAAAARGERVVLWSVDSRDWVAGETADEIANRVLGSVEAGSIVLMHDGGGNREATLAALPLIVAGIRARGLSFVALAPVG